MLVRGLIVTIARDGCRGCQLQVLTELLVSRSDRIVGGAIVEGAAAISGERQASPDQQIV